MEQIFIPAGEHFSITSNEEGTIIKIPKHRLKSSKYQGIDTTDTVLLAEFLPTRNEGGDAVRRKDVIDLFERYGKVSSITDLSTKRNALFRVEYEDHRDAADARIDLDGRKIYEYVLQIR